VEGGRDVEAVALLQRAVVWPALQGLLMGKRPGLCEKCRVDRFIWSSAANYKQQMADSVGVLQRLISCKAIY
jgi:hypothetical protein